MAAEQPARTIAHRALALSPDGEPVQALEGFDYARILMGLARFTLLLPEAEQFPFAARWASLAGQVRALFSRYDGAAIPRYVRREGLFSAEGDPDVRLSGYLARVYGLVHEADRALEGDEVLLKDVRAWGTGEPVKLLNFAMRNGYSRGRFLEGRRVTSVSMAAGLQHIHTLWQAYRVGEKEHKKQTKRDRLWRFLGYTPKEALELAREVDRVLLRYWNEGRETYLFEDGPVVSLFDLAGLIEGHNALAGLYRLHGESEAAEKVEKRQRQLVVTVLGVAGTLKTPVLPGRIRFQEGGAAAEPWQLASERALSTGAWQAPASLAPVTNEVLPGTAEIGDAVDVPASFDLIQALADSVTAFEPVQREDLRQRLIEPLLHRLEIHWSQGVQPAETADQEEQLAPERVSLGALGTYLAAAAAYYTAPDHPRLTAERMEFLKAAAEQLLWAWEKARPVTVLIPHPRRVVHRNSPPDWLLFPLLVLGIGGVLALTQRFWPARWNPALPVLGGLLLVTVTLSGLVGGTLVLAEKTSGSEFCASCHVIAPKVNDLFNPKSRSLAARHYWHEWIKGDRLECYSCHQYGEGVRGFVVTKLQGTREVLETALHLYEEPIRPRQNLNPTCMQCHWRTLDPKYINDPYHLIFQYQMAVSQMQCSACHVFHPRNQDVKKEFSRPEMIYQSE